MKQFLRHIPPIHELQTDRQFQNIIEQEKIDQDRLTTIITEVLDQIRQDIISGLWQGAKPGTMNFIEEIFSLTRKKVETTFNYTLKRVINATGTIIHTNLGRARLSENALQHLVNMSRNYSNLEYNLYEGERGSRHDHVEQLLMNITGAESAMVVNNNAAAVYLILRALAMDKEVIVSRGELVEIGGSFRISSIMEESGANLVEIGTTNKTHYFDYENAITEETAMILKVHTSNFKTIGFTEAVDTNTLVELADKHEKIIYYEDLGSGVIFDLQKFGVGDEPVVNDVLKMGAHLVSFSGDKLLGGPQAGIIAGKKSLIDRLKKHQLARVLRVDKLTLAALEGTLIDYAKGLSHLKNIPTVNNLLVTEEELQNKAEQFIEKLTEVTDQYNVRLLKGVSQVGGGTMPGVELPTFLVALQHDEMSAEQLGRALRRDNDPAIVVRIANEEIIIDVRTITAEESKLIIAALQTFVEKD